FDFIVVDTASQLDDFRIGLFEAADYVLHVINPTLPCVKNARTVLNLMDAFNFSPNKSQLVMNRVDAKLEKSRVSISVAAIEYTLKHKAPGVIPLDQRRVLAAVSRGRPVVAKG